jgi:hypothetical protein
MCKEEGKTKPATIVDHIQPHRGDTELFFKGELQSLCKAHHDSVKQSQEHTGIRRGFDGDGMPLDKDHPWFDSEKRKMRASRL